MALTQPRGKHLICYCKYCQKCAEAHNGTMDENAGVALFQTRPDFLEFRRGTDNLACETLTKGGPLRWYTTCCDTHVANMLQNGGLSFVGIPTHGFQDPGALGPVSARVNRDAARGDVPRPHGSMLRLIASALGRALAARVAGRQRINPFFEGGQPVATPTRGSVG